jgi:acyl transferase domain-containing protein
VTLEKMTQIAIVGIGCKLPGGVDGPEDLVRFLESNGDGVVEVPSDRWSLGRFYSADRDAPGRAYVRKAAFLRRDISSFDPAPFSLSPREAEVLDPQQRLLLEVAWDALEDAGIDVTTLRGSSTGVYIGAFMLDMRDITSHPQNREIASPQTPTGTSGTVLSNRISYTFDLRGPSLTIDTACSSSLVAIHAACTDLANGTCNAALAGGVNVMLSPTSTLIMCKGHFLAADGRSKSFDDSADGYGRGEGASLVLLKRLEDALRDGDRIYATILGSGVNQDGRTDGMPMPNPEAQEVLARQVAGRAGINPEKLGYVEAHGTGTRAGDPIEVAALAAVYGGEGREEALPIGSIKSNIGHLEAAAGATGLIKAALSLYHGKLFPLRALGKPNADIPFEELRVRIPLSSEPWPERLEQTAAVNSFGYGGTNAHVVLGRAPEVRGSAFKEPVHEEMPPVEIPHENQDEVVRLTPLSAFDDSALRARAEQLIDLSVEAPLALASTLAHRRAHLPVRATIVHGTPEETREAWRALATSVAHPRVQRGGDGEVRKLLWVFTGMGPQWWGMGQELYRKQSAYRAVADQIDEIFGGLAGFSLLSEMNRDEATSKMARNRIAQPANFVVQAGFCALLREHGVQMDGILGHSVGELAAAWAAGCLSLEEATQAAFHRSDLQDQVAGQGGMLAASISLEEAEALCRRYGDIAVAAINAPGSTALSGSVATLKKIEADLAEEQIFARMMRVEVAYHSHQMEPLRGGFLSRLAFLRPESPRVPLYSTALGQRVTSAVHDAEYFWINARSPVLLQSALALALADGYDGFLEIGPHPVLGAAIQENARVTGKSVRVFNTLKRQEPEVLSFASTLGNLHCAGCAIDWQRLAPRGANLKLPLYPFQRKPHWHESELAKEYRLGRPGAPALLDQRASEGVGWTTELDDTRFGWLSGHEVLGSKVFPAAGYIDLALSVARERLPDVEELVVEDLRFESALVLSEGGFAELAAQLSREDLVIFGRADARQQAVARCRVSGRSRYRATPGFDRDALCRGLEEASVEELYERFSRIGLNYSGPFRGLERVWIGEGEAVGQLKMEERGGHLIFPPTLDATFQLLLGCTKGALDRALIPVRVRVARIVPGGSLPRFCHVKSVRTDLGVSAHVAVYDAEGAAILRIEGLECEPVERHSGLKKSELSWIHRRTWQVTSPSEADLEPVHVVSGDRQLGELLVRALREQDRTLLESIPERGPIHVVFVADRQSDDLGGEELAALTLLTQHLAKRADSRLTVVTQGAYECGQDPVLPDQSAIVGFSRTIMTEHPELRTRVLDVSPFSKVDVASLVRGLHGIQEEEVALREGAWLALRVVRGGVDNEERRALRRAPQEGECYELHVARPGSLDSLVYRPRELPELGEHEVEVTVEASGLNFKDVMKGMGMLDSTALYNTYFGTDLGIEASGTVVRTGSKVTHVRVGDHVYASVGGSLSSRLRLHEHFAVRAAKGHSPQESCSYLVFLTAWHALVDKAQLKAGERVLIHSAAGGVGLAAIQIARHIGAELFVTAGTEEKREYLRRMGIANVYDSRSLDFVEAVREVKS